jgi:hypothetical protein
MASHNLLSLHGLLHTLPLCSRVVAYYGLWVLHVAMHNVRAFFNLFNFLKTMRSVNLHFLLNILDILDKGLEFEKKRKVCVTPFLMVLHFF